MKFVLIVIAIVVYVGLLVWEVILRRKYHRLWLATHPPSMPDDGWHRYFVKERYAYDCTTGLDAGDDLLWFLVVDPIEELVFFGKYLVRRIREHYREFNSRVTL